MTDLIVGRAIPAATGVHAGYVSNDGLHSMGPTNIPGGPPREWKAVQYAAETTGPVTEQELAGVTRRVTPADIEAEIVSEFYFTAADGVLGESQLGTAPAAWTGLDRVTFAILTLRNHTKVVGINYGAIDPQQHSAERGRAEARKQAEEKVWELLGFRLRDKLVGQQP